MFDRTIIAPQVRRVTERVTEHVHEHRAPTDESVRLLAEMEAAARDKIIEAVHVGDTTFECVVHMERTVADDSVNLLAIFSLNGRKMRVECTWHTVNFDRSRALLALRGAIAQKIATEVLGPILQSLQFQSWKG